MTIEYESYPKGTFARQAAAIRQNERESIAREWYLNAQIKSLKREVYELKVQLAN